MYLAHLWLAFSSCLALYLVILARLLLVPILARLLLRSYTSVIHFCDSLYTSPISVSLDSWIQPGVSHAEAQYILSS